MVTVRDLPVAGVPVLTRCRKRVFHCPHVVCPNKSWTEQLHAIAPYVAGVADLAPAGRRGCWTSSRFAPGGCRRLAGDRDQAWRAGPGRAGPGRDHHRLT